MTVPKTVLRPKLYDTLMSLKREIFLDMNCVKPGNIDSYDPDTRTARVNIGLSQRLADASVVTYPVLFDLPVVTLQGGGVGVGFPITEGDECLVFFSDRCIDTWIQSGSANPQPPPSGRLHDISDGFALVGVNSLAKVLELALSSDEGGIADDKAKVSIKQGKIAVANDVTDLLLELTNLLNTLTLLNTAIAAESGVIPTAATAATAANVSIALIQIKLNQLLYTPI